MVNVKMAIAVIILLGVSANFAIASVKDDIEKANKKGQVVFLVVTEEGNPNNQEAINLALKAQKLVTKSAVLELDRRNSVNKRLVQKYRLSGAPMPLLLVIGRNGYAAGGAPLQNLTADALVKMVPSLKEEEVLKAINEENSAFVVFSKKSDSKIKKQLDCCQSACQSMSNKAIIVVVDIEDKMEKSFINKFDINTNSKFPITCVINTQGDITSMFNGITEAKTLVEAAKKKVSSGCCPPGSGKTCGPTKKK